MLETKKNSRREVGNSTVSLTASREAMMASTSQAGHCESSASTCPLTTTTVTVIASQFANLPQCQAEQGTPPPSPPPTLPASSHGNTVLFGQGRKGQVTIAVLDHGLDRDWRHCPSIPPHGQWADPAVTMTALQEAGGGVCV